MNKEYHEYLETLKSMQYALADAECAKLQRQARRARKRGLDDLGRILETEARNVYTDGLRHNFPMASYQYPKMYKYAFHW